MWINLGPLLDKNDSVVEVLVHKTNTKRSISVDVLALKFCASLNNVHCTDGGTSLRCVMKWSLKPLIWYVDLETFAATETAYSLDWVNLLRGLPVLDFHECVMKWHTTFVIA